MFSLKSFSIIAVVAFVLMAVGFVLTGGKGTPVSLAMATPFAALVIGLVIKGIINAIQDK